ncbi:orotate phosphoribosyltransferase [Granulicella cerasi]|uniref:Orotate phosphoribosyltransferase n=1 Tax=Granulicella cerasi TaxID=741063 RepID=A0ABW1Z7A1_9BACT|nr:orotate phosphoribosyltransferase [Granulicella cerasi]
MREIAQAILEIGAAGFCAQSPITFKSGIVSPVYCDNRRFPYWPAQWKLVIEGFAKVIVSEGIACDVIAGVEAAGIPHSAALGFATSKPSVFVRKQAKDHGTKKLVEGGDVAGKRVVLVEDLVTTGMSSQAAIEMLRAEGAECSDCFAIISYGFAEAEEKFREAGVKLHALTNFAEVLEEAKAAHRVNAEDAAAVTEWLQNPRAWSARA